MVEPLFSVDGHSHSVNTVHDGSPESSIKPLFADDSGSKAGVHPVFAKNQDGDSAAHHSDVLKPVNPLFQPGSGGFSGAKETVANPLFDPTDVPASFHPKGVATNPPPSVDKRGCSMPKETVLPSKVGAVFETPKDPVVETFVQRTITENPTLAPKEKALRSKMQGLFPMDFNKVDSFAEDILKKESALVSEVHRSEELYRSLDSQNHLQHVITSAKATQQGSQPATGSLLNKIKHSVSAIASHEADSPAQWYATLHRIKGSLKLVSTELPTLLNTGQDVLESLTQYAIILKTVAPGIQDTSLQDAANRRLTLLLGAVQQVQIDIKRVEQLQSLVRQEMQNCDEVMTITLPALGFTI